jgi:hypothetical protein
MVDLQDLLRSPAGSVDGLSQTPLATTPRARAISGLSFAAGALDDQPESRK